jgi:hypothetical protein
MNQENKIKYIILFIIICVSIILLKRETKEREYIKNNGKKTVGIIFKYSGYEFKTKHSVIYYTFQFDSKLITINGKSYSDNPFPTCEKDSSCIGRKFAVYYLPENPKKYHVPVFEEEMK